jgi:hypothetical protein
VFLKSQPLRQVLAVDGVRQVGVSGTCALGQHIHRGCGLLPEVLLWSSVAVWRRYVWPPLAAWSGLLLDAEGVEVVVVEL